ncbi:glycosyltransferase family 1 protein [Actinocorallia sp. API 0066]|uniref:glycosyltransferase family 4 protein n=1 Tax=Actinocorallia sp. API 0066 TaxID=2896846 RepID=UPI001E52E739|nr:glycosyltransferase family 1 protein [Actinocorallia sp. API 0066]MCD0448589.1 glycosyltransferase family 1 protein [Actinocorallia sp. API 0066]
MTNSVCRVLEHLAARGHEALIVAPAPGPDSYAGAPVELVPGLSLPVYRSFVVGVPGRRVEHALRAFQPDVVHLASPIVLGAAGATAARRLGLPSVAVFQTDIAGFFRRYGFRGTDAMLWSWLRHVHAKADRTLAPSRPTLRELEERDFPRLGLWGRGVDQVTFTPERRCDETRARLAPDGEVLVGYMGRLAPEKQVELLASLDGLPGVRLVVIGDGPSEDGLRKLLPKAAFTGFQSGTDLARLLASLDVFVHTGANETFCQALQEALASGLPAVAPAAGGPLDLVRPGVNGLLFRPSDGSALRAAVATLAADPDTRARMGAAARQSVRANTWEAVGDRLLDHYTEVIYGTGAGRAVA